MPKVFISDRIPKAAADTLTQAGFTVDQYLGTGLISEQALAAGTHDADFLIATLSTQVTKAVIDQAQRLKLIANYGAGFNNIDVAAASARHIPRHQHPGGVDHRGRRGHAGVNAGALPPHRRRRPADARGRF